MIFLWLCSLKSELIFLETCYLCVFYSFYITYACFVIFENYLTIYVATEIIFLMLCFCFKNLDFLDRQTTHFDFPLSTLFLIFTSCGLKYRCNLYTLNNTLLQFLFQFLLVLFLIARFSCLILWVVFFWQSILNILILLSDLT